MRITLVIVLAMYTNLSIASSTYNYRGIESFVAKNSCPIERCFHMESKRDRLRDTFLHASRIPALEALAKKGVYIHKKNHGFVELCFPEGFLNNLFKQEDYDTAKIFLDVGAEAYNALIEEITAGNNSNVKFLITHLKNRLEIIGCYSTVMIRGNSLGEMLRNIDRRIKNGRTPLCILGKSPLMAAIESSNMEAGKLLINAGAEIRDSELFSAIKTKNEDFCIFLIESRADVNETDYCKKLPMFWAINEGLARVVESLIEHKASLETAVKKRYSESPMDMALTSDKPKIVATLLNHRANIVSSIKGAIETNDTRKLKLLVECKASADLDGKECCWGTFLHQIIRQNKSKRSTDLIKLLLQYGLKPNEASSHMYIYGCPLSEAVAKARHEELEVMLSHNSTEVNYLVEPLFRTRKLEGLENLTPLLLAVWNSDEKSVALLLAHGARVYDTCTVKLEDKRVDDEKSIVPTWVANALLISSYKGDVPSAKHILRRMLLIDAKHNKNNSIIQQQMALVVAAATDNGDMVYWLLNQNTDINCLFDSEMLGELPGAFKNRCLFKEDGLRNINVLLICFQTGLGIEGKPTSAEALSLIVSNYPGFIYDIAGIVTEYISSFEESKKPMLVFYRDIEDKPWQRVSNKRYSSENLLEILKPLTPEEERFLGKEEELSEVKSIEPVAPITQDA